MDNKKLMLNFTGNKAELHTQLKIWCAKSDKSMNKTVLALIEALTENHNGLAELVEQKLNAK